jgi:hypothetical protein
MRRCESESLQCDPNPEACVSETLTLEEAKTLIALCRAGKLYEIERWIASGKSIRTPAKVKAPLQVAIDVGFHFG